MQCSQMPLGFQTPLMIHRMGTRVWLSPIALSHLGFAPFRRHRPLTTAAQFILGARARVPFMRRFAGPRLLNDWDLDLPWAEPEPVELSGQEEFAAAQMRDSAVENIAPVLGTVIPSMLSSLAEPPQPELVESEVLPSKIVQHYRSSIQPAKRKQERTKNRLFQSDVQELHLDDSKEQPEGRSRHSRLTAIVSEAEQLPMDGLNLTDGADLSDSTTELTNLPAVFESEISSSDAATSSKQHSPKYLREPAVESFATQPECLQPTVIQPQQKATRKHKPQTDQIQPAQKAPRNRKPQTGQRQRTRSKPDLEVKPPDAEGDQQLAPEMVYEDGLFIEPADTASRMIDGIIDEIPQSVDEHYSRNHAHIIEDHQILPEPVQLNSEPPLRKPALHQHLIHPDSAPETRDSTSVELPAVQPIWSETVDTTVDEPEPSAVPVQGFSVGGPVISTTAPAKPIDPADTVPAMLTPGEFVVNAVDAQKHLPLLQHLNQGGSLKASPAPEQTVQPQVDERPVESITVAPLTSRHLQRSSHLNIHQPLVDPLLLPTDLAEAPGLKQPEHANQYPDLIFRSSQTAAPGTSVANPTEWNSIEDLLQITGNEGENICLPEILTSPVQLPPILSESTERTPASPIQHTTAPAVSETVGQIDQNPSTQEIKTLEAVLEALAQEIYSRLRYRFTLERERQGTYSGRLPW